MVYKHVLQRCYCCLFSERNVLIAPTGVEKSTIQHAKRKGNGVKNNDVDPDWLYPDPHPKYLMKRILF